MDNLIEDPRSAGILGLGLRLMSTPGKLGPAIGTAGLGAMQDARQARIMQIAAQQRALEQQMLQQQLAAIQRQQEERAQAQKRQQDIDGAYRGAWVSPPVGGDGVGPQEQPRFSQEALIRNLLPVDAVMATQMAQPQPDELMTVAPGASVINKRSPGKPVYTAPSAEPKLPGAVQEYEYAKQQGYPGTFEQWELSRRRAGATNIGLPKIDIKVGEGLAKEIGPMISESYGSAAAAPPAIENSNRIIAALDSGKVIAGPMADTRVKVAQLAQVLGVGGSTNEEVLLNTRQVIQGLAQSTLNARAALKGQGAITNFEQNTLEKAVSGNIAEMTVSEIRQIAALNKRLNEQVVQRHRDLMDRAKKQPGLTGIAEMFEAPALPADAQAPTGGLSADEAAELQQLRSRFGRGK